MMNTRISNAVVILALALAAAPVAHATTVDPLTVRLLQGNQPGASMAEAPERDIRIDIWTGEEDEVLRRGDEFTLLFQTNADLYVVVYRIDVDGLVEVIWPESRYNDGFVYGNHTYSIPAPNQGQRLRVGNRKGVEYIEAIASAYPFDLRALGIDFRFDRDEHRGYDYYVDGDPFLAVNDINYAITGLEEDADFVVTDWMHLYVEERVEYARYSCNQCHLDDGGHPTVTAYVDTCTQVEVRVDYGWHNSWWVSFGWYPLYVEPAFYYWDWRWSRPYWYAWYPVPYRWPAYSCYTRPYPVWWWESSGYWGGNYVTQWTNRRTRSVPLYDVERVRSRTTTVTTRDGTQRTTMERPVSARGTEVADGRRVDRDSLVRNSTPTRRIDRGEGSSSRTRGTGAEQVIDPGRRDSRGGAIRTDRGARERIVSQRPADDARRNPVVGEPRDVSGRDQGRRWTRPQVQNEGRPDPGRDRSGSIRGNEPRRSPNSEIDQSPGRGSGRSGAADRSRSGSNSGSSGSVDRSRSGPSSRDAAPPRQNVDRSKSGSSGGRSAVKPNSSGQRQPPKPAPSSRQGSGSSRDRKGGGGGGGRG